MRNWLFVRFALPCFALIAFTACHLEKHSPWTSVDVFSDFIFGGSRTTALFCEYPDHDRCDQYAEWMTQKRYKHVDGRSILASINTDTREARKALRKAHIDQIAILYSSQDSTFIQKFSTTSVSGMPLSPRDLAIGVDQSTDTFRMVMYSVEAPLGYSATGSSFFAVITEASLNLLLESKLNH